MNLDDITFVYILRDYNDEFVFTSNKFKSYLKNIIIVTSENYQLKLPHTNYKRLNIKDIYSNLGIETIFKSIQTDWIMLMKPEEAFAIGTTLPDTKEGNYIVIVSKPVNNNVNHNLVYGEIKLFHRNANINSNYQVSDLFVINNEIMYPIINKTKTEAYMYAAMNNRLNLESIVFLAERNIVKLNIKEIFDYYYNENDSSPEMLNMILYVAKNYIINKNLIDAKIVLEKGLVNFPNSPNINSLLSEVYFMLEDYNSSEFFIRKCIEMGEKRNFYMHLPFSPAIVGYAAQHFLARILDKQGKYDDAKDAYEKAIDTTNSENRERIISEYKSFIERISKDKDGLFDDLAFTCQSCGNCCRHFRNVNVTHHDVLRIMEHKPELKFDDIAHIVYGDEGLDENYKDGLAFYSLKKQKDSIDCIFLKDNMCTINDYKPLGCKVWPFLARGQQLVTWAPKNKDFIKKYCSFKYVKGANDEKELLKTINESRVKTKNSVELLNRWKDKLSDGKFPEEFIEELKKNYP